jgi:tRNA A-37 threonylcarbamoyl transferase component Bud32
LSDSRWISDVATALADGAPVDWEALESELPDSAARALLANFRRIEVITKAHGTATRPAEAREPSGPETTPASWGPLTIVERIGQGASADVYRAVDPRLDRVVALKLRRQRVQESDADAATLAEARMLARVHHPNVVTIHGADRLEGTVGLWMEFVDGVTLAEAVRANGPFLPDQVVAIGVTICNALSAIHRAGLLHRDVKAQNVMIDRNGRTVLTDLGAGCELPTHESRPESPSPDLAGTPLYLAPEVLGGAPPSQRSEVYSVGVLLYYLASGLFPVEGRSLRGMRDAHELGRHVPLRTVARTAPGPLARVIDAATEPDDSIRYADVEVLCEALRELQSPGNRLIAFLRALFVTSRVRGWIDGAVTIGRRDVRRPDGALARLWRTPAQAAAVTALVEIVELPARWLLWRVMAFGVLPALAMGATAMLAQPVRHGAPPATLLRLGLSSATVLFEYLPVTWFYIAVWRGRRQHLPVAALAALTICATVAISHLGAPVNVALFSLRQGLSYAEATRVLKAAGLPTTDLLPGFGLMAGAMVLAGHVLATRRLATRLLLSAATPFVYLVVISIARLPMFVARVEHINGPWPLNDIPIAWMIAAVLLVIATALFSAPPAPDRDR